MKALSVCVLHMSRPLEVKRILQPGATSAMVKGSRRRTDTMKDIMVPEGPTMNKHKRAF